MKLSNRNSRRQAGLSTKILTGSGVTLLILILGVIGLSISVLRGIIGENTIQYITPVLLLLSVFVGTYLSGKGIEDKLIAGIGTCAAVIFLLLTITILFFGGRFENVILNIIAIIIGGLTGFCMNLLKPKARYRRKR